MFAQNKCISILFYLLFISVTIFAQNEQVNSTVSISGKIINATTFNPVPHAAVTIKRLRKGAICDSLGYFRLQVLPLDTLEIKVLGYESRNFTIPANVVMETMRYFQIKIHKTSYLLDEVDIYALGSWDEFKHEFLTTKIVEKNPINKDIYKELAPYNCKPNNPVPCNYRNNYGGMSILGALFNPVGFIHSKLSGEEKRKRKLTELFLNQKNNEKIQNLYNADIVAKNTGLQGDSLENFLVFCNPKMKIDENSLEYEISKQIHQLLKEWKKKKSEE